MHGDIHYEGGLLTFSNVKAGVYGGRLLARGDYDIDSRAYNIYINAWDMDTRYPLKSDKFYCLVDLVGEMHCDGNPADLDSFGTFQSGSGFYMLAPFEKSQAASITRATPLPSMTSNCTRNWASQKPTPSASSKAASTWAKSASSTPTPEKPCASPTP